MFRPNQSCVIRSQSGYDLYGMATMGARKVERCAVVTMKMASEKSSVRADSSGSRGNALEIVADLKILLGPKTTAKHDAIVELHGNQFVVKSIAARFNIAGKLDHYEVLCTYWGDKE